MSSRTVSRQSGPVQRSAAAVALLLVVVGFPVLLAMAVGWPLPQAVPSWQQLQDAATSALQASTVVKVLACGAWAAWLHFTVCVLVEVRAEMTGRSVHVPFGGINRQVAHRLVATVLLAGAVSSTGGLTAAHALAVPAASSAPSGGGLSAGVAWTSEPAATPVSGSLDRTGGSGLAAAGPAATAGVAAVGPDQPVYVVQPPHRGYVDNLWDIAERHLGSGPRWREIYALNQGREQQVGGSLSDPDKVRVGWRLLMPADAVDLPDSAPAPSPAASSHTVRAGQTLRSIARDELGDPARAAELFAANAGRMQPDGGSLRDPSLIRPGWVLQIPGRAPADATLAPSGPPSGTTARTAPGLPVGPVAPGVPAPAGPRAVTPAPTTAPPTRPPARPAPVPGPATPAAGSATPSTPATDPGHVEPSGSAEELPWVRTVEGIGALLAAFLLVRLARRRSAQAGARRLGQRIPMPTGSAETTELELRAVEDPIAIVEFDGALRRLAAAQHRSGQPLPQVRAARITAGTVELYLVEPATPPAPWVAGAGAAAVWTLRREQLRADEPDGRDEQLPAPYPALVTVGQDDEAGHVLVDLEQIAALGVTGPPGSTLPVLGAIAVELASSTWAQEVDLTLVGVCPELPGALPDRPGQLRYTPNLEQLIGELERRADVVRDGLQGAGLDSPLAARGRGSAPDAWAPEIVLLADPVPDALRDRLEQVLHRLPRVGVAAVTGGGALLGQWALQVHADGQAVLQPAGLTVTVQQIPADKYADVLQQLAVSVQPPVAGPAWAAALPSDELRVADLPEQVLLDQPDDGQMPAVPGDTDTDTGADGRAPARAGSVRLDLVEDSGVAAADGGVDEQPAGGHRADALVFDLPGTATDAVPDPAQPDAADEAGELDATATGSGSVRVDAASPAPDSGAATALVVDLRDSARPSGAAGGPAALPAGVHLAHQTEGSGHVDLPDREDGAADLPGAGDALLGHDGAGAAALEQVPAEQAPDAAQAGPADVPAVPVGGGLVVISSGLTQDLVVPLVRVLGDVAVLGARGPLPVHYNAKGVRTANVTARCTALIVYLALNPGAVRWDVLAEQLSPGRRWEPSTARHVATKARTWLGADDDGSLFFPLFAESGDYRLRPDVRTDWQLWLDLVGTDLTSTPTGQLDQALALVQGAPFSNIKKSPNYYAWAEPVRLEMMSGIVDVAHEVARRVLLSRDHPGSDLPASSRQRAALARRAVRVGRLVDAGSELMFRDALLVEHRTGNALAMRQLAQQVVQHAEDLDSDLEPETEQLLSDLKVHAR